MTSIVKTEIDDESYSVVDGDPATSNVQQISEQDNVDETVDRNQKQLLELIAQIRYAKKMEYEAKELLKQQLSLKEAACNAVTSLSNQVQTLNQQLAEEKSKNATILAETKHFVDRLQTQFFAFLNSGGEELLNRISMISQGAPAVVHPPPLSIPNLTPMPGISNAMLCDPTSLLGQIHNQTMNNMQVAPGIVKEEVESEEEEEEEPESNCNLIETRKRTYVNNETSNPGSDLDETELSQIQRIRKQAKGLEKGQKVALICVDGTLELKELEKNVQGYRKTTKSFDWRCKVCDKAFASEHKLELHEINHFATKSFKCLLCSADFEHLEARDRHQKTIHGL